MQLRQNYGKSGGRNLSGGGKGRKDEVKYKREERKGREEGEEEEAGESEEEEEEEHDRRV